jgi:acetate kinase
MMVLALNSGSSSFKFGLFQITGSWMATLLSDTLATSAPQAALADVAKRLTESKLPPPDAIGHRVVHGGATLREHCLIDAAVMRKLDAAIGFAPLHMPAAIACIRMAQQQFPNVPHVACFDTCFHSTMPDIARVLPIPKAWQLEGIQRYGFHGLAIESVMHQLGGDIPSRMVVAHLGHGASVTAIKDGHSIDTSMGLTPSGGVIMGTRTGDLDPGVLLYLMREKKLDAAKLAELIDHQSGLLGISGVSSDMRELHAAAAANLDARLAISMFCYSVGKHIAAMIAALDGIDLLVFTGGIGEHDAQVRLEICSRLAWMGISLNDDAPSRCAVRVVPAQEEAQMALHTWALAGVRSQPNKHGLHDHMERLGL